MIECIAITLRNLWPNRFPNEVEVTVPDYL